MYGGGFILDELHRRGFRHGFCDRTFFSVIFRDLSLSGRAFFTRQLRKHVMSRHHRLRHRIVNRPTSDRLRIHPQTGIRINGLVTQRLRLIRGRTVQQPQEPRRTHRTPHSGSASAGLILELASCANMS